MSCSTPESLICMITCSGSSGSARPAMKCVSLPSQSSATSKTTAISASLTRSWPDRRSIFRADSRSGCAGAGLIPPCLRPFPSGLPDAAAQDARA